MRTGASAKQSLKYSDSLSGKLSAYLCDFGDWVFGLWIVGVLGCGDFGG